MLRYPLLYGRRFPATIMGYCKMPWRLGVALQSLSLNIREMREREEECEEKKRTKQIASARTQNPKWRVNPAVPTQQFRVARTRGFRWLYGKAGATCAPWYTSTRLLTLFGVCTLSERYRYNTTMKTSLTSPRSTEFSPTASGVRCPPDCTATVQHCKEISNAGHIAVSRFAFNPSRKDGRRRRKETRNKGMGWGWVKEQWWP